MWDPRAGDGLILMGECSGISRSCWPDGVPPSSPSSSSSSSSSPCFSFGGRNEGGGREAGEVIYAFMRRDRGKLTPLNPDPNDRSVWTDLLFIDVPIFSFSYFPHFLIFLPFCVCVRVCVCVCVCVSLGPCHVTRARCDLEPLGFNQWRQLGGGLISPTALIR